MVTTVLLHWTLAWSSGLYRGRHGVGTSDEAALLTAVVFATGIALLSLDLLLPDPLVPRSVPPAATFTTLVVALVARVAVRTARERRRRRAGDADQRVVVFGAGACGRALVHSMVTGGEPGYRPVALLDDDPDLRERRVHGVPVRGTRLAAAEVARRHHADLLVVAIRRLEPGVLRDVTRLATTAGLAVKVLPPLRDRLTSSVGIAELHDLDVRALLGRTPRAAGAGGVATRVAGRRVLVTGAGGSIGSELCRQLATFGPEALLMLDRDESALHAVSLSIYGSALLDSPDIILADIRDAATVERIFAEQRPDVVFHAAALKHLPMLEQYPAEAWKTNVLGTVNVLDAARRHGVGTLVNISTDKAANPTSVLGRSKRIGERLVAGTRCDDDATFVSVRFGNVLGSRGSVLTTFYEQLLAGGPVTITDPQVCRYFMTVEEAVSLVVQAAAIGRPGEALVLDMGQQVRIEDLARHLMELVGVEAQVVYTGLREGEKLREELYGLGETGVRRAHPAISHVPVPPLPIAAVRNRSEDRVRSTLDDLSLHPPREVETVGAGLPGGDGPIRPLTDSIPAPRRTSTTERSS